MVMWLRLYNYIIVLLPLYYWYIINCYHYHHYDITIIILLPLYYHYYSTITDYHSYSTIAIKSVPSSVPRTPRSQLSSTPGRPRLSLSCNVDPRRRSLDVAGVFSVGWMKKTWGDFIHTWWFIPLSKWVITPVISRLTPLIPFITRVVTHLRSVGWATKQGSFLWVSSNPSFFSGLIAPTGIPLNKKKQGWTKPLTIKVGSSPPSSEFF